MMRIKKVADQSNINDDSKFTIFRLDLALILKFDQFYYSCLQFLSYILPECCFFLP